MLGSTDKQTTESALEERESLLPDESSSGSKAVENPALVPNLTPSPQDTASTDDDDSSGEDDEHERMFPNGDAEESEYAADQHSSDNPDPALLIRHESTEGDESPRQFYEKKTQNNKTDESSGDDNELSEQDRLNFFGRWIEIARFLGGLPALTVSYLVQTQGKDYDDQLDGVADKIGGVLIGGLLHLTFRRYYQKIKSLNPLYRNFKTLAFAGTAIGIVVASLTALPMLLSTVVFSLGLALFSIPYKLLRDRFLVDKDNKPIPMDVRNRYFKTGIEGWSKYGKTFLVFGMYAGELFGLVMGPLIRGGDLLRNLALFGAIGSVVSFVAGLIIIPVGNRFFKDIFISKDKEDNTKDKNTFRNNYVRSGITLGIAVGTIIGFIAWPGAAILGMTVGAAFGAVAGGIALGAFGLRITKYIQVNWHIEEDTHNSWDYATRNSSYLFGFIGAAIGFFVPVPGGLLAGGAIGTTIGGAAVGTALAGATICGAVASVIGWGLGLVVIRAARITKPKEKQEETDTLPWTQRIAFGSMYGSMLGASLGFTMGLIGGPALATMGGTLGFSAGAVAGGLTFGLWDDRSRELIGLWWRGETFKTYYEKLEIVHLQDLGNIDLEDPNATPSPDAAPVAVHAAAVSPLPVTPAAATVTELPIVEDSLELEGPASPMSPSTTRIMSSFSSTIPMPALTVPTATTSPKLTYMHGSLGERNRSSNAEIFPVSVDQQRSAEKGSTPVLASSPNGHTLWVDKTDAPDSEVYVDKDGQENLQPPLCFKIC
jgi:uncharacterized membrane protein